jgi:hypothetical protein
MGSHNRFILREDSSIGEGGKNLGDGLVFRRIQEDTASMITKIAVGVLSVLLLLSATAFRQTTTPNSVPEYTSDAQLRFPEHYREWVYLSSGFDMSYNPAMQMNHHMFDNVFVNPEAYQAFLATGAWPDKTMLVLESRRAESKGSINHAGNYQGSTVMGVELHVKDASRFPGKWAFFGFGEGKTAKMIPQSADCYSCHAAHAAVDTTFVQFYPSLLPIAQEKGTLSPEYKKETGQ